MGKTGGGPERLPAQRSQVNLNAAGIDVGATSHFVAVPQDRAEQPVREFAAFTADYIAWRTGWPSAQWRPWSWSRLGCTGSRGSGC